MIYQFSLLVARCDLGSAAATLLAGSISLISSLRVIDLSGNGMYVSSVGGVASNLAHLIVWVMRDW